MNNVQKAIAISDAKISFVSLVNKAANKRSFLITKAEDGEAQFSTYGRIVKTDTDHHFVTGIVYEPMTEDAHGNYMTEEEITKAAYWYAKNNGSVDLQHSFQTLEKAEVVESWVAKADFELGGETVKKGTWLMTVEVTDEEVWDAIQKEEITGFSMGGVGKYDTEETDLENEVEKNVETTETNDTDKNTERKGIFKKLAELFGFDVVEKGEVKDEYERRIAYSNFWEAFYTLQDALYGYDSKEGKWAFEDDETVIRGALSDFNSIVTDILAKQEIAKSLAIEKAGKTMSAKNKESLTSIYNNLGAFLAEVNDEKETEETEMTKTEIEKMVAEAVAKAVAEPAETPAEPATETPAETPAADALTAESVQKMIDEAIAKALAPQETEKSLTTEDVKDIVEKAVASAIEPVLKSRGLPYANNENTTHIEKGETHYLAGIL